MKVICLMMVSNPESHLWEKIFNLTYLFFFIINSHVKVVIDYYN